MGTPLQHDIFLPLTCMSLLKVRVLGVLRSDMSMKRDFFFFAPTVQERQQPCHLIFNLMQCRPLS